MRSRWLFVFALAACSKDKPPPSPPADASAAPATFDGRAVVTSSCLSCHSEEMLAQQRLTHAQWTKVVTKMSTWGATLEPSETTPLIDWLAATYGPDAGPYTARTVDPEEAARELAPQDDGPYRDGDPERGRGLYLERCSGCHGAEARGHIGVRLVDRPSLWRATDFADVVRRGRGKMTPTALSDAQVGDVLAHLRTLRE